MTEVPEAARAEDDLERLVDEVATVLSPSELAGLLTALGVKDVPRGLLPTYHCLRATVLAAERGTATRDLHRALAERRALAPVEPLFERVFFVFGLRRAGNHALSDWLAGHFAPTEVVYLNSADLAHYSVDGSRYAVDFGKYSTQERAPEQRVLIVGYENLDPLLFPVAHNSGIARRADGLVLLRDLVNMSASIARGARERPSFSYRFRVRDFPDLWCRYARLHLSPPAGLRPVSYNAWVADAGYRRALQHELGLPTLEVGRDRVGSLGGGSSFDGTARDGRGSSMEVLKRWEGMRDDKLLQFLVLAHEEALSLNASLFSMDLPPRKEWLRWWRTQ